MSLMGVNLIDTKFIGSKVVKETVFESEVV